VRHAPRSQDAASGRRASTGPQNGLQKGIRGPLPLGKGGHKGSSRASGGFPQADTWGSGGQLEQAQGPAAGAGAPRNLLQIARARGLAVPGSSLDGHSQNKSAPIRLFR
jgi:hypothetical protein